MGAARLPHLKQHPAEFLQRHYLHRGTAQVGHSRLGEIIEILVMVAASVGDTREDVAGDSVDRTVRVNLTHQSKQQIAALGVFAAAEIILSQIQAVFRRMAVKQSEQPFLGIQ